MTPLQMLLLVALVVLALWLAVRARPQGACPMAGTGACRCGMASRPSEDLLTRS